MGVSEKDIKRLWGLAAGRCSEPTCATDCIRYVDREDPVLIGEMAHVIAQQEDGPRGKKGGGEDTYQNLILLCPSHHRLVDKAPARFPEILLHEWKAGHEGKVRRALEAARFESKQQLCAAILRLLIENHAIWKTWGPESAQAKHNPLSSAAELWTLRKLAEVLPNNRRIINLAKANSAPLSPKEYAVCCEFFEHAEGFEQSAYDRREGVPRFPQGFEEVVRHGAR